ncbi:Putative Flp pilus-assembly TadE/G-like [Paramicrobacterium humi]|uniref:Putative Flp pilus-assembly TadE/G-like n=1 Tax=Paramicrobacterium humi TaxID=640635 RepID=A0A1H4TD65_9MICO|nr:pilus assembly protein TadG-related protein [Microbacterium humi]SEC54406.1 Putative Flp pilus-assembly TadE/G-like [Microbacterium humi]
MRRDDEGSTLILTIFYGVFALLLVLLVAAITSLYLERKQLSSLADAAALVGAEAFTIADVSAGSGGPTLSLRSPHVQDAVAGFLEEAPTDGFEGLSLERAASLDGVSATVTLSSYWRPPVVTVFLPEGIRIDVTSVARSVFDD